VRAFVGSVATASASSFFLGSVGFVAAVAEAAADVNIERIFCCLGVAVQTTEFIRIGFFVDLDMGLPVGGEFFENSIFRG
jgi:hypothetical protein